jgi:short-chain 2-methylacyl-CoA dehydrogenase
MQRIIFPRRFFSMMRFTEDQEMLRMSVREFAKTAIGPLVSKMDKEATMDSNLIKKLFEAGYMGLEAPLELKGSGMSFGDSIIVIEEISRVDPSVGILVDIHNTLVQRAMILFGDGKMNDVIENLGTTKIGSFCLSENLAGSDAFNLQTKAERKLGVGDSVYEISGSKLWISSSKEAEIFLVFARDMSDGGEIKAFICEKSEGVVVERPEKKLGLKASSTCPVQFERAQGRLLSAVGGKQICMALLNEGRIGIAAQMLGICRAAYQQGLDHVMNREQFKQRLFDFQAMRFDVAKTKMEIDMAELLIWKAIELKQALPSISSKQLSAPAAMAKLVASELAGDVTRKVIDWMGGMGYCSGEDGTSPFSGSSVEKLFRDAKIGTIYEGTSNMQLETIAKSIERGYGE